ncbi:MAG: hypothetical protein IPH45_05725 [Bacteroidales bacterium]|nr:hypothetical protein [Bacteroidales bacterium]
MVIEIKEVKSKKDLHRFIHLPAIIHEGHSNWVPPIYLDDRTFFNPSKNKAFEYCDTILALAYKNGKVVGRIMGIVNHRYNEIHQEKDGRFCFMETWNDTEVFHALISYVENWAREKGMQKLVGPLGFSDKDPQGFMVHGFGEPIVLATNGNFPYMPEMLEAEGYTKKIDCVVYKVLIPDTIPEFYQAIYKRALINNDVEILEFTERKKIKPLIHPVLRLLNETFADLYAFAPFDEKEMDDFANRYLPLLDPNFIKVVRDRQGNILSFIIGMPDISKGIIACKGRILPFGILRIIHARAKSKQLNLLLGGIREEYRGKGLDVIMGIKMLETAKRRGMHFIDSHLELETNHRMRREMEKMGGEVYKRYRIYQKQIVDY